MKSQTEMRKMLLDSGEKVILVIESIPRQVDKKCRVPEETDVWGS